MKLSLNPVKVLADDAARKAEVKPLPVVKIGMKRAVVSTNILMAEPVKPVLIEEARSLVVKTDRPEVLNELWIEMGSLKRQRAKLSSNIAYMVGNVETEFRKENAAIANEFIKGNLSAPELSEHWEKIQSLTEKMQEVFDKITSVEKYGQLPAEEVKTVSIESNTSTDVKALLHEIRRMDDVIYQNNKKIIKANGGIKAPKNSDRVNTWREKVALAEARRVELKHKLKKKQYEAREQRIGGE